MQKKKHKKKESKRIVTSWKPSEFVKAPLQSRFTNIVKVKILLLFTCQTYRELMF